MTEPPVSPDLPDDTVVLGGLPPEPPRERPRLSRRSRWVALALAIVLVATVAWFNRPGRGAPVDDVVDDARPRRAPLYVGAQGRLLFTVLEEPRAGEIDGDRVYILSLESGEVENGPLLPPVGTEGGVPPGPGVPPDRSFMLGPVGTTASGLLALLADGPEALGHPRFAYVLDMGRAHVPPLPLAVGRADAIHWTPQGRLLALRTDPVGAVVVDAYTPRRPAEELARLTTTDRAVDVLDVRGTILVVLEPEVSTGFPDQRVVAIAEEPRRTLLRGWTVLGAGTEVLLQRGTFVAPPNSPVPRTFVWSPGGGAPRPLDGFQPFDILGWTSDRLHYAAIGEHRGEFGLWYVRFPNVPVFRMAELDREGGYDIGPVAFDRAGRVAFFVNLLDLWMVEIGSERSEVVELSGDVARKQPSGPVVWLP